MLFLTSCLFPLNPLKTSSHHQQQEDNTWRHTASCEIGISNVFLLFCWSFPYECSLVWRLRILVSSKCCSRFIKLGSSSAFYLNKTILSGWGQIGKHPAYKCWCESGLSSWTLHLMSFSWRLQSLTCKQVHNYNHLNVHSVLGTLVFYYYLVTSLHKNIDKYTHTYNTSHSLCSAEVMCT